MKKNGARPTWLFYVGVNDVDATAKKVEAAGGADRDGEVQLERARDA